MSTPTNTNAPANGLYITMLDPLLPIEDVVPLHGLGYDEGSQAHVVTNLTRAFRNRWYDLADIKRGQDEKTGEFTESAAEYEARILAAQYDLAPHILKRVVVKKGDTTYDREINGPDDVRWVDEVLDPFIMDLAIGEALERGREKVIGERHRFRLGDQSGLKKVGKDKAAPDDRQLADGNSPA